MQKEQNQAHLIDRIDAHHRFFVAIILGIAAYFLTPQRYSHEERIIFSWNVFALTIVALAWVRIIFSDAATVVNNARLQDAKISAIFVFVILAATASLVAVAALLGSAKGLHGRSLEGHVLLAAGTVIASWLMVHTVFTLHYAHAYYRDTDNDPSNGIPGGLEFPGEEKPDFMDFAYFSFVIGMTFQVSDVTISSKRIRRLALIHGLLSFAFNTVILALAINVASSLLG